MKKTPPSMLILSSYPPRKCGIATFTSDLVTNLKAQDPDFSVGIVALGDGSVGYGDEVVHVVERHDEASYRDAARWIDASGYDVLLVEHEYGLYGADDGKAVVALVENVHLPVVATLHTVLVHPSESQRTILHDLCRSCDAVVTMAGNSKRRLVADYGVDEAKIQVIAHGVPSFAGYPDRDELKRSQSLEGRTVISTFGLLSEGKGIEYGIEAMAKVVPSHPEVIYLVAGQTHPVVREKEGEAYRRSLEALVASRNLSDHVRFIDRFFSQDDIVRLLLLSDVYMTPYLGREQAVSGTLAYAAGCGRAIVSTSYPYARELLGDGRGCLADFADASSLAVPLRRLLDHPDERKAMEHAMGVYGASMGWDAVSHRYGELVHHVLQKGGAR